MEDFSFLYKENGNVNPKRTSEVYFRLYKPELLIKINNWMPDKKLQFNKKIWFYMNQTKIITCGFCGKIRNPITSYFRWLEGGFAVGCNGEHTSMILYGVTSKSLLPESKELNRQRVKESFLTKYGVENVFQLDSIKEKSKQTCLEKYGSEYANQNEEIKEKIKETNLEKYGTENVFQNEQIKEKSKQTCLEKYGSEYAIQNEEIKNKVKNTNLEKYGSENVSSNQEIKNKVKNTNLEKYGSKSCLTLHEFKNKLKKTNLERYGTEYANQNEEIKEKIKKTNLERYGVEHILNSPEIRKQIKQTIFNNFKLKLLKQGISIYEYRYDFKIYKRLVESFTHISKKNIIKNVNIGKAGEEGAYHIDHKFSIKQGFLNGILPCIIGSICNLELLTWEENMTKGSKCSITKEQLIKDYQLLFKK